eukprot:jgi/Chlat1/8657/Chrsp87S08054
MAAAVAIPMAATWMAPRAVSRSASPSSTCGGCGMPRIDAGSLDCRSTSFMRSSSSGSATSPSYSSSWTSSEVSLPFRRLRRQRPRASTTATCSVQTQYENSCLDGVCPVEFTAPSRKPLHDSSVVRSNDGKIHPPLAPVVPVYVMLPLDTITLINTVNRPNALRAGFMALKSIGVEGVMVDVWWGIVEGDKPKQYEWEAYRELLDMIRDAGLKCQAVMSFHSCGGNVGDCCSVSLPRWVMDVAEESPDVFYTDRAGWRNGEYLSLSVDNIRILHGRTPIEAYRDFMASFRNEFADYMGCVITEVEVGLGPAGELRYPSYPEGDGRWCFPGIGEFQCYDKYMLANLKAHAEAAGQPRWGVGGPHDSGHYKQWPEETGFFRTYGGSWDTDYGRFFLEWYSNNLVQHGSRVLAAAEEVFKGTNVQLAAKVSGIHWWYNTHSHASELTAGYYNTIQRDGYQDIAEMLAKHGAVLNFTCAEMRDKEQPPAALCSPEGLLRQARAAAYRAGITFAGENALPRFDRVAHEQICANAMPAMFGKECDRHHPHALDNMATFTFLRMGEALFRPNNWNAFTQFVKRMNRTSLVEAPNKGGRVAELVY